jgi:hypothetical protein
MDKGLTQVAIAHNAKTKNALTPYTLLRSGRLAIDARSRGSICSVAPGPSNRYVLRLAAPVTVMLVAPVYS